MYLTIFFNVCIFFPSVILEKKSFEIFIYKKKNFYHIRNNCELFNNLYFIETSKIILNEINIIIYSKTLFSIASCNLLTPPFSLTEIFHLIYALKSLNDNLDLFFATSTTEYFRIFVRTKSFFLVYPQHYLQGIFTGSMFSRKSSIYHHSTAR